MSDDTFNEMSDEIARLRAENESLRDRASRDLENLALINRINLSLRQDAIATGERHAEAQDNIYKLIAEWETPSEEALNAAARVEYEQVRRSFGEKPRWETDLDGQRHYREHVDPATRAAFKAASDEFLIRFCTPEQRSRLAAALSQDGQP